MAIGHRDSYHGGYHWVSGGTAGPPAFAKSIDSDHYHGHSCFILHFKRPDAHFLDRLFPIVSRAAATSKAFYCEGYRHAPRDDVGFYHSDDSVYCLGLLLPQNKNRIENAKRLRGP